MSEWKTGEPPEDGWYWVWEAENLEVTIVHFDASKRWWEFVGAEDIVRLGREVPSFRWQGPLTPPEAPFKEDSHEA